MHQPAAAIPLNPIRAAAPRVTPEESATPATFSGTTSEVRPGKPFRPWLRPAQAESGYLPVSSTSGIGWQWPRSTPRAAEPYPFR